MAHYHAPRRGKKGHFEADTGTKKNEQLALTMPAQDRWKFSTTDESRVDTHCAAGQLSYVCREGYSHNLLEVRSGSAKRKAKREKKTEGVRIPQGETPREPTIATTPPFQ